MHEILRASINKKEIKVRRQSSLITELFCCVPVEAHKLECHEKAVDQTANVSCIEQTYSRPFR